MSQTMEVKVPDIGDFSDVPVIEVMVAVGDAVEAEQSLITLESDKATIDVPSPGAGTVREIRVKEGDKLSEGSLILILEPAATAAPSQAAAKPAAASAAPAAATSGTPATSATSAAPTAATAQPVAKSAAEPNVAPAAAPSSKEAGAATAGQSVEVKVPDIGDYQDVPVIEVLVSVGDHVSAEQSLITLESDKATMDVPTPVAGIIRSIAVKAGDTISEGKVIAVLETEASAPAAPAKAPSAAPATSVAAPQASAATAATPAESATASFPQVDGTGTDVAPVDGASSKLADAPAIAPGEGDARHLSHASPSVRKFARELGVDVWRVKGSGPKGRVTQEDVRAFVKQALTATPVAAASAATATGGVGGLSLLPWPKIDFSKFGPAEAQPLSRIKKIAGANLHRNWVMIPHVTNNDEADITELEAFRLQLNKENEKSGNKVTMLAFLMKACVFALRKFPLLNSSLDGDSLVFKKYFHIGFAADTPNGLVVPVIRDVDKKGVFELAKESGELAKLAREGKLKGDQMQGGCFSISSLGGIGGGHFTPIINAPEVAILGVGRNIMKPVWNGKDFDPRLMLPLSLSYDHRVIDGAEAARFNAYLTQLLADFRRATL
ncbi:MAG: dihydrolipoyllysine-residue acetyltransferase [Janthinobacterium lividum]